MSNYQGRCAGRLFYFIELYTKSKSITERVSVIGSNIHLNQGLFATYSWLGDSDVPFFIFYGNNKVEYETRQAKLHPYVTDRYSIQMIEYVIEELKEFLSKMPGALDFLRLVRDTHNDRLDVVIRKSLKSGHFIQHAHTLDNVEGKIIRDELRRITRNSWSYDQYQDRWEHLTLHAIQE